AVAFGLHLEGSLGAGKGARVHAVRSVVLHPERQPAARAASHRAVKRGIVIALAACRATPPATTAPPDAAPPPPPVVVAPEPEAGPVERPIGPYEVPFEGKRNVY